MALCGYLLSGFPSPDAFYRAARAARELDVIEFGIPADEPALEGPRIAAAHQVVTQQRGIHAETSLALIAGLKDVKLATFVMTYAAVARNYKGFLERCVECGLSGVIAPDADSEEVSFVAGLARPLGLVSITLLDARANDAELQNRVEYGDIIYVKVSAGPTGQPADLETDLTLRETLRTAISRVRALKPDIAIACGIGISKPGDVRALAALGVDMAIVGTKILERFGAGEKELVEYIAALKRATYYPPEIMETKSLKTPVWLALDIGTTGTKAALFAAKDGAALATAYRDYSVFTGPQGVSEQNAADWWRASSETIMELAPQLQRLSLELRGLALTGQMQNVVLVDSQGDPVRPVILYSDTRARSEFEEISSLPAGDPSKLREITGNEPDASGLLAKLLWLAKREPEVLASAAHLLFGAADFVALKLTGQAGTDSTTASTTGMMDLRTRRCLSEETMEQLGLGNVVEILPTVYDGGQEIGKLLPDVAAQLGLPPGTSVFLGPGDAGAVTIGAGAGEPGHVYVYLGTSGWIGFTSAKDPKDTGTSNASSGIFTLAHPQQGRYMCEAAMLTAGGNLAWVRDLFDSEENYESLVKAALGDGRQPSGLIYLPYLNGERAPFQDPLARGAFIGLSPRTAKADLQQAALEGVAFAYRHLLEEVAREPLESLTMTGGGTKALAWCQLLADVLGLPIDVVAEAELVGARGAMLTAQVAIGECDSYAPEGRFPTIAKLEPRKEFKAVFDKQYAVFKACYPALKPIFADLNQ